MSVKPTAVAAKLRTFGLIWIVLAPILFLMAAISTVKSEQTYGTAILVLVWPAQAGPILRVAMALMIAAPGMPFPLMARRLRHVLKTMSVETAPSSA